MLFIFETEREASLCLRTLFPNPQLVEEEKLRIRVKVMPRADLDWNFQSSLIGFRSFPARSWLHFYNVPTSSETCKNVPTIGEKVTNSLIQQKLDIINHDYDRGMPEDEDMPKNEKKKLLEAAKITLSKAKEELRPTHDFHHLPAGSLLEL